VPDRAATSGPRDILTTQGVRERDRHDQRARRIDQRRAAPAGDRARAGVKLSIDDFTRIGKRAPVLADLKPSGKYVMAELIKIGGLTPLMKRLLDRGLLHGER
jgi:hypothetical protein